MVGYYTEYNMTVHNVKDEEQLEELHELLDDYGILQYALDFGTLYGDEVEFFSCGAVKWHEHEEDMKKVSKEFPDMVFQLRGNGDDPEDIWEKYFQNGECETCMAEITIPKPERIKWD